jgi:hypothetical protein
MDIVERLRNPPVDSILHVDLLKEAADEIDHLREIIKGDAWVKPRLMEMREEVEELYKRLAEVGYGK